MKFVEANYEDTAATLSALSLDMGHTGYYDVRATSAQGFMVHDDVADAYGAGQKGTLTVTHQPDPDDPLRIIFDATPTDQTTTWDFGDGWTASQNDGHTIHWYAEAGTYTVTVGSPGRADWQGPVIVAPVVQTAAATTRSRRKAREAG